MSPTPTKPRAAARAVAALAPLRPRIALAAAALVALAGCANVRGTEASKVSSSQDVTTAYWFRGTPLSLEPVSQGDIVVQTPLANGGTVTFTTWFSGQLTNKTGDAIFPDGHGGEATEIDMSIDYGQRFDEVDWNVGVIGYHYPEIRPTTKEFYVGSSMQLFGLAHAVTAYYDTDLLDDFYLQYQASRGFTLDDHWSAALAVLLGYMSDDQAAFYFGKEKSGLSDLLLSGSLSYHFDANTSLFLKGAGVTVPDDQLSDALDQVGLDDSGLWLSLGIAFGL